MPKYSSSPRPLPSEGFARLPQVLDVLGLGKTCFLAGVKSGRFPAPLKLGPHINVCLLSAGAHSIHEISYE